MTRLVCPINDFPSLDATKAGPDPENAYSKRSTGRSKVLRGGEEAWR